MRRTFLGDLEKVIASLPKHIGLLWTLKDTGHVMCDSTVINLSRALATRTSRSAIAETINEMKATSWMKTITLKYISLCEHLSLKPLSVPRDLPIEYQISSSWLGKLLTSDAEARKEQVKAELDAEEGDDILALDWTKDAAKRCGCEFLFNAMDGKRHVLLMALTKTCQPSAAQPFLMELSLRGVRPKVVYVDSECCGAWTPILNKVWPGANVRLDGMHAIMRLTRTTTSTQHPWHGRFCNMLAGSIYTYDTQVRERLSQARAREGSGHTLPKHIRNKYVPRVIADSQETVLLLFCMPLLQGKREAWSPLPRSWTDRWPDHAGVGRDKPLIPDR